MIRRSPAKPNLFGIRTSGEEQNRRIDAILAGEDSRRADLATPPASIADATAQCWEAGARGCRKRAASRV